MRSSVVVWLGFALLVPWLVGAQAQHAHGPSPYAGETLRSIKSLSDEDIAELRSGGGWGLARTAELNGVPGPAHLLELKQQIPLTPAQVSAIEAIHQKMRSAAMAEGERLIALEQDLESLFRDRTITDESLRRSLEQIEASRRALRYIHLSAHLTTPALLSPQQVARYNKLRGYGDNPCSNIPAGHDPVMWRKHNACN